MNFSTITLSPSGNVFSRHGFNPLSSLIILTPILDPSDTGLTTHGSSKGGFGKSGNEYAPVISAPVSPDLLPGLLETTFTPGVLEKTSQTTCSANTPLVYSCFALKESVNR